MATDLSRLRTLSQLTLSLEPARDTQLTFRIVLDAMARPGTVRQLPVAARDAPVNPWLAAVLVTLLDHEVGLAVEPFDGSEALERFVRQRTAVASTTVEAADFVVASAERLDPHLPLRLRQGSLAYPNDSATLLLLVYRLDQAPPSSSPARTVRTGGILLDLAGPGVAPGRRVWIGGLDPALFEVRDEVAEYPCGIDLILVDPSGRVAAFPRTTAVQVANGPEER